MYVANNLNNLLVVFIFNFFFIFHFFVCLNPWLQGVRIPLVLHQVSGNTDYWSQ